MTVRKTLLIAVGAALCWTAPATAQDYCECIDGVLYCYGTSTPSYDEPPLYQADTPSYYFPYDGHPSPQTQSYAPSSATYSHHPANPDVPPELIVLLAIAVVVALIGAIASSSTTSSIDKDVEETQALTEKLEDAAREADAHIAAYLAKLRSDADG